jgi:hypothetical protein
VTPIDRDYLLILEALEGGVVPNERSIAELVGMGLIFETAGTIVLTPSARLRLLQLRALARAADIGAVASQAASNDS